MTGKERRFHIISVRDFSLLLSKIHGADPFKVELAALSHDMFRDVPPKKLLRMAEVWGLDVEDVERKHPVLLHGKIAGEFLRRRFGFEDEEVILAVSFHTSGHPKFNKIGKILTVADTVAYDRDFPGVDELRSVAFRDLERAYFEVIRERIVYALMSGRYVLKKSMETWNELVDGRESR